VQLIDQAAASMSDIGLSDRTLVWNTDLIEALELQNLMGQAVTMTTIIQSKHRLLSNER
jgi:succinate dehydrogenase / fumarate reductase flavoprotein subunit